MKFIIMLIYEVDYEFDYEVVLVMLCFDNNTYVNYMMMLMIIFDIRC
jgi:hypothetical protein